MFDLFNKFICDIFNTRFMKRKTLIKNKNIILDFSIKIKGSIEINKG